MATLIDKIAPNPLTSMINSPLTSTLNRAWRLAILANRGLASVAGKEQNYKIYNPGPDSVTGTSLTKGRIRGIDQSLERAESKQKREENWSELNESGSNSWKERSNKIYIHNVSTSPTSSITIQGRPRVVDISHERSWATVKSMGRNNPFYMYTGGEDTVSFEISWYSMQDDRQDVINKCRLLESWTAADGYNFSPPIILIQFGGSDLFILDRFILQSAPYQLSNFQDSCYLDSGKRRKEGGVRDLQYYPNTATQSLTFKKIAGYNRTHEDFISKEQLASIENGVEY